MILHGMRQATLFLLLLLPLVSSSQTLQIDYPYNPDYDNTGNIGVNDLLPLLTLFTQEFEAEGIMLDTLTLEDAFLIMMAQIIELQGQVEALQAAVIPGLSDHLSIVDEETILVSGANLQVVNGEGSTSSANGLGNVIVGYNESDSLTTQREGSHNLVMGRWNQYNSYGGIVHGLRNSLFNHESAAIAGSNNVVSGVRSAVIGGDQNTASGNKVVAIGGLDNEAKGSVTAILGGSSNVSDGTASVVVGGNANQTLGNRTAVLGGGTNVADGHVCVVVGGEGNSTPELESGYAAVFGGRYNTGGDYCGAILGGYENTTALGLNIVPGYGTQTKTIVGGRGNLNVAASHSTILGGEFLVLEPRDTAFFYGNVPGFYGPANDVGIGNMNKVYVGDSSNPQFILTGSAPDE